MGEFTFDDNNYLYVDVAAGGGSSGNSAAGPTGSSVPADADYIGFDSGGDLVGVSSGSPLPVTVISGGGSNASVGTTGSTAPTSATEIGYVDGSGNLAAPTPSAGLPVQVENSSIAVTGTFYPATQPVSGTITVVGDSASGSAVAGNPVLMAGSDGTDARSLLTSNTGQLHVIADSGTVAVSGVSGVVEVSATSTANSNSNPIYTLSINGSSTAVTQTPTTASAQALTPVPLAATAQKVIKNAAGNVYGVYLLSLAESTTTTASLLTYCHFFNTSTTASLSTTTWQFLLPIPVADLNNVSGTGSGNPLCLPPGPFALGNFSNGIVVVVNTTSSSNTTAAGTAPVGVIWVD